MSGHILAQVPERFGQERLTFTPQGHLLMRWGIVGAPLQLFEATTGKPKVLENLASADTEHMTALAIGPDGRLLVIGNRSGNLQTWDLKTGKSQGRLGGVAGVHRNDIRSIEFSPDGQSMLTVESWRECMLMGHHQQALLGRAGRQRRQRLGRGICRQLAALPDDASRRDGAGLETQDLAPAPRCSRRSSTWWATGARHAGQNRGWHHRDYLTWPYGMPRRASWRPRYTQIQATSSIRRSTGTPSSSRSRRKGSRRSCGACAGERLLQVDGPAAATAVAFARDGSALATGSEDGRVRLWSTHDGNLLHEWSMKLVVNHMVAHPDGQRIVVLADGELSVRDIKSGTVLLDAKMDEEGAYSRAMAVSEDGTLLFLACNQFPQIWDLRSLTRVRTLAGHEDEVWGGGFSPDGRNRGVGQRRSRAHATRQWQRRPPLGPAERSPSTELPFGRDSP